MEYHVKFYGNTGFSLNNIPYCIEQDKDYWNNLLSDKLMFERDIYINANLVHPYIDIAINLNEFTEYNILNCDYLEMLLLNEVGYYHHLFYIVNNIVSIQEDVYRLYLSIDAINSIGGIGADTDEYASKILQGTIQRMHVRDDVVGNYTLDEPFQPKEELELEIYEVPFFKTNNYINIVELSSIINNENEATSYRITDPSEVDDVRNIVLPNILPLPNKITEISDFHISYRIPATAYFNYNRDDVKDLVKRLRQTGTDNAIINSWSIPSDYFSITENVYDLGIHYIDNINGSYQQFSSTIGANLNCVNKKCNVGRFNIVSLLSICSGEKIDINIEDVIAPNGLVVLNVYADPRPNGTPIVFFTYFKGQHIGINHSFLNSVCGVNWRKNPIVFTTASGEYVARRNFYYDKEIKEYNYSIQNFNNLLRGANKTLKDINRENYEDTLIDLGTTVFQQLQNRAMQQSILNAETNQFELNIKYVQPQIVANYNESIREAIGNAFILTRTKLSNNDLLAFDKFLTNYGYNVGSKPYTDTSCLTDRTAYNYIQFSDIHIKSFAPQYLVKLAEQQFLNGIRLWHKLPSFNDYATNANPLRS